MSYKIFFEFSTGLAKTIKAPIGTLLKINSHIKEVEDKLKIKRTKYLDNPERWVFDELKNIDDELLCNTAIEHNSFIRDLYNDLEEWAQNPPKKYELITPEKAEYFFVGLTDIIVPVNRWTKEYYISQMDTIYEVLRGRETDGISFDELALTEKQAGAVISIFSSFLDNNDMRLAVPDGHDYLASSYDGGYDWCVIKGAVLWEDANIKDFNCKNCEYNNDCSLYDEMVETERDY